MTPKKNYCTDVATKLYDKAEYLVSNVSTQSNTENWLRVPLSIYTICYTLFIVKGNIFIGWTGFEKNGVALMKTLLKLILFF